LRFLSSLQSWPPLLLTIQNVCQRYLFFQYIVLSSFKNKIEW
jgi:hypothetical protein